MKPFVVLVIVGFCLLLGVFGSCMIATQIDPATPCTEEQAMMERMERVDRATKLGAVIGLVMGVAAVFIY